MLELRIQHAHAVSLMHNITGAAEASLVMQGSGSFQVTPQVIGTNVLSGITAVIGVIVTLQWWQ